MRFSLPLAATLALLSVAVAAPPAVAGEDAEADNPIETALEALGLDARGLAPDPIRLAAARSASSRPTLLRRILAEPLAAGYRIGMTESNFQRRKDSPHRLFLYTASLSGASIARGYIGNPLRELDARLLEAEDPLAEALAMIGQASEPFDVAGKLPAAADLPNPLRHEFARLVAAISSAERFRKRALRNVPVEPADLVTPLQQIMVSYFAEFDAPDYRLYIEEVEAEALQAGMLDLAAALEDFEHALQGMEDLPELEWSLETPLGVIVLTTKDEPTIHDISDPLLIMDLGGNDLYALGNAEESLRSGISITFDAKGNDRYRTYPGRGASGLFGYGMQWDLAGDDLYESSELGQGSAIFGGAMLLDRAGNDEYIATRGAQAYAVGGAALLVDFGGDDSYEASTAAQASAGPYGAAVLFDDGGNDSYLLRADPLVAPSSQLPETNNSMGQGCGVGLRADITDGRSLAGGTGLLIDSSGDDSYQGEVFCQGAGFLDGIGALVDGGGADTYTGRWYAQAAGAHGAAGVLIDRGPGDDMFTADRFTSMAAGHDFSVGFLINEEGNDRYALGDLGLGTGNDNGTGIFVDVAGDDEYALTHASYGMGAARVTHWGTAREAAPGLGLFFDLGGTDTYTLKRQGPADNALWQYPRKYPDLELPSEAGAGLDGSYESPFNTGPRTENDGSDEKQLREAQQARRAYRAKIKTLRPRGGN